MADYSNSKMNPRGVFPENAVDAKEWSRVEPLMTASQFQRRFLFGIPLVTRNKNPVTQKPDVKTPDDLADHLLRAVATIEMECGIDIFPVKRSERHPFDRNFLEMYGYMRVQHKPILSVDKLAIKPGNGEDIYVTPNEWISDGHFAKGQINVVPLVPATATQFTTAAATNGAAFLIAIQGVGWVPSYWAVDYTSGFPDGLLPRVINEIIGCQAAIDVCTDMAVANFQISSHSLGIDGMSQSQSTPGPQVYKVKIDEMKEKKAMLISKIKSMYGIKWAAGTI
jgi:hypothetical protein